LLGPLHCAEQRPTPPNDKAHLCFAAESAQEASGAVCCNAIKINYEAASVGAAERCPNQKIDRAAPSRFAI
jgi:hypothetical protein